MRRDPSALRFPAMGGEAVVIVHGDHRLTDVARQRVDDLERKWSRFLPDSDVSRLNAARDRAVVVSADTLDLLRHAVRAWELLGGAFDPSVLDALVAWGYDRDLPEVRGPRAAPSEVRSPGLGAISVDHAARTACLGGAGFDPGGVGKGRAADLVAAELVAAGAAGALVGIGGDIRIAGDDPGAGWTVGVEDPSSPTSDLCRLTVRSGGLATSSDRRRRWTAAGVTAHHLIDPGTGRPARSPLAGITVLAGEAWWADALTKAVLVGGVDVSTLARFGASGIARTREGRIVGTADLVTLAEAA